VASKAGTDTPPLTKRQLTQISRAIADPTRFEVFQRIAAGRCVACSDLRENISVTAPTLSHHIKELETAGLIESTRNGKFMNLTLRSDIWRAYLKKLGEI
jgi:ArsR family transcriptional regulator